MLAGLTSLSRHGAHWLPLVVVIALPFLLSLVAVLWQRFTVQRLEREYEPLPIGTGRWVQEVIAEYLMPVDVGVHPDPHGGADGYWPGVGFIALTEGTWQRRYPSAWAIGAHELGHSLNIGGSATRETLLPVARLAYAWSGQAFAAMLVVAALYPSPTALWAAFAMAVFCFAMSAVILWDEGMASRHGYELLQKDGRLDAAQLEAARDSLMSGFSVYLAQALGRLGILLCWFGVHAHILGGAGFQQALPSALATWLAVLTIPILFLRTAHVLTHVFNQSPVVSEFRLATEANTEARWEFLTGMCVAALVWGLHGISDNPVFVATMMLAAVPAVGPVAALGRIPVLVPVVLAVHSLAEDTADNEVVGQWMREEQVPGNRSVPAPVLDFHNNPPLYLRYSWLLKISYLPLLVCIGLAILGG